MLKTQVLFVLLNMILIASGAFLGFKAHEGLQNSQTLWDPAKVSLHPLISEPTPPDNHPLSFYQYFIDRDLFNTQTESRTPQKPINPDILTHINLTLKLWVQRQGMKRFPML